MAELFLKGPEAVLDYRMQWQNALMSDAGISRCTWSVSPAEEGGVEVVEAWIEDRHTMVRLSGGKAGHSYSVTAKVELSDGSVDQRSMLLRVEER